MPTDVLLVLEARRIAEKNECADEVLAAVILPLLACVFMVVLAFAWPALRCALLMMGALG